MNVHPSGKLTAARRVNNKIRQKLYIKRRHYYIFLSSHVFFLKVRFFKYMILRCHMCTDNFQILPETLLFCSLDALIMFSLSSALWLTIASFIILVPSYPFIFLSSVPRFSVLHFRGFAL